MLYLSTQVYIHSNNHRHHLACRNPDQSGNQVCTLKFCATSLKRVFITHGGSIVSVKVCTHMENYMGEQMIYVFIIDIRNIVSELIPNYVLH